MSTGTITPVSTSVSDLFYWEAAIDPIASNVAPNNKASTFFQLDSDKSFVLFAFVGSTNYDAFAGDFIAVIGAGPAAARTLITPPFVPNNFEVQITYNNETFMTGAPIPQALICSNGYRTGNQLPFPIVFAPMTTFNFDFYNVAATLQQSGAGVARDLQISFGLFGYFVENANAADYLLSYPEYACVAEQAGQGWISQFTNIEAYRQIVT